MPVRDWFRPPRQLMLVFLVVALASTGALAWLTSSLLTQDREAEQQRRRDALDHAADAARTAIERQLIDLERSLDTEPPSDATRPSGVVAVSFNDTDVRVWPQRGLLYYPSVAASPTQATAPLLAAERLEIAAADLGAAARAYGALSKSEIRGLAALALARVARVERKRGANSAAIEAYDRLSQLGDLVVDGLPAVLIARAGRASLFEETQDRARLGDEAAKLRDDLLAGRLHLTRAQFTYYLGEASRWLSVTLTADRDAVARAEGVQWLWEHAADTRIRGRRVLTLDTGAALLSWRAPTSGGATRSALVVGPAAFDALMSMAVPAGISWGVADLEGHFVAGGRPPARNTVLLTTAATGFPFTLHVFPSSSSDGPFVSSRRTRLLFIVAGVTCLLIAGWYFIWRGVSREIHVARLQSDFVAAVSHEFRSPLTSLRHIADLLSADRVPSEERRRRSYELLRTEADRLGRLVEGLLDFGRFQAGQPALRVEVVDLGELARAVTNEFRPQLEPDRFRLDLGDGPAGLVTLADREALSRAIWNLLDNAVKYSPQGGTIRAVVAHDEAGRSATITVSDEGLGIPDAEQRHVFDRFVRGVDAKARRIRGTGIGLALVRDIMRAHNGDVAVASRPGAGSTFTLTLPLTSVPDLSTETPRTQRARPASTAAAPPERI